jgi:hypothetical protein
MSTTLILRGCFTMVLATCNMHELNNQGLNQVAGWTWWQAVRWMSCSCHSQS